MTEERERETRTPERYSCEVYIYISKGDEAQDNGDIPKIANQRCLFNPTKGIYFHSKGPEPRDFTFYFLQRLFS